MAMRAKKNNQGSRATSRLNGIIQGAPECFMQDRNENVIAL